MTFDNTLLSCETQEIRKGAQMDAKI